MSRISTPVRSLAVIALAAIAGAGLPVRASPRTIQTYRGGTDLVVLQVGVYDDAAHPVTELSRGDFLVYEDGELQDIRFFLSEDRPVAVGLVIDNSASMRSKRAEVIAAADAFARSSHPDDALFTVNFNERVWFGLPPDAPFTSDRAVLHQALSQLQARGLTAIYDAVDQALDHVATSPLETHVLIVVSDGGDNGSHANLEAVLKHSLRQNTVIYAVGLVDEFSPGSDRRTLERLADATGGLSLFPHKLTDVQGALEQIARDVRHRYTIGYEPSNSRHDGSYRHVRVVASKPREHHPLRVRTRAGYLAPGRVPES